MAVFVAIANRATMANLAILTILAIMACLDMAKNITNIGVYGKNRRNVDHPRKRNWKNATYKKYGQIKIDSKI